MNSPVPCVESNRMSEIARPLRIALAQMNPTVGDIDGNARKIREYLDRGVDEGAQLVVFPELAVNGYPPEDLLLKTHFLAAGRRALEDLAQHVRDTVALVGFAEHAEDVFNSLAVLADGRGARHLPQDVPAQLRRVRRAALLPGRRHARDRAG